MRQMGSIYFYCYCYSLRCVWREQGTAHSEFRKTYYLCKMNLNFSTSKVFDKNIRILCIVLYIYIKYNVMLFYQKVVFCHYLALHGLCSLFNQVLITSRFVMKLYITQKATVCVFRHLSLLTQREVNILSPFPVVFWFSMLNSGILICANQQRSTRVLWSLISNMYCSVFCTGVICSFGYFLLL